MKWKIEKVLTLLQKAILVSEDSLLIEARDLLESYLHPKKELEKYMNWIEFQKLYPDAASSWEDWECCANLDQNEFTFAKISDFWAAQCDYPGTLQIRLLPAGLWTYHEEKKKWVGGYGF